MSGCISATLLLNQSCCPNIYYVLLLSLFSPYHTFLSLLPSTSIISLTSSGCPRPVLTSKYSLDDVPEREDIESVLELIRVSKPFPEAKLPGSVVRQREIVAELEEEFNMSAVNQVGFIALYGIVLHCIVFN